MRPLIIAHRGFAAAHPENSLAAFRAAAAMGVDGIELDVHGTADGALAVHHDAHLARRPIGTLTLAEVRRHRLSNGEPVPTLEAALEAIGASVLVFVEVKTLPPACDAALLEVLSRGPAPAHYHVHSFDHRIVHRLIRQQPHLVGGVLSSSYPVNPWAQLADAGARELWQEDPLVDATLVEGAHQRSYRVYAWTVDQPARASELAALGVDGLCTNRPDLLQASVG